MLAAGDALRPPAGRRRSACMVEFVSANPTGPLHVGHGRQAALGDAICNLLETQGWRVTREFYYNDAGVQIATLAASVAGAAATASSPGDAGWPESAYNGDYIADIAADFLRRQDRPGRRPRVHRVGRRRRPRRHPPVRRRLPAPRAGPRPAGLRRALRPLLPRVEPVRERPGRRDRRSAWSPPARPTRTDGALWLRTTDYGDDKDRVMRKSDGTLHLLRARRRLPPRQVRARLHARPSTSRAATTTARSPACAPACRPPAPACPPAIPDYVLHKMVTVMRGGEEVKISKRAGSYVTLRDLIDWTSRDAVRFFLHQPQGRHRVHLRRRPGAEAERREPGLLRPVRACPHLLGAGAVRGAGRRRCAGLAGADLARLTAPSETALMRKLADYPADARRAPPPASRRTTSPSTCATWPRPSTATTRAERFLVDDAGAGAGPRSRCWPRPRQVLRNALALLGVGAPERMNRETEPA